MKERGVLPGNRHSIWDTFKRCVGGRMTDWLDRGRERNNVYNKRMRNYTTNRNEDSCNSTAEIKQNKIDLISK